MRTEGLPIPVTFGRMRLGGSVISEYAITRSIPSSTDLYLLLSFGEGPFYGFGNRTSNTSTWIDSRSSGFPTGILIEGNPAENFPGCEAQVRMGTLEQTTIEGFHDVPQVYGVSFTLLADTTDLRTNSTLQFTNFFDTSGDAFWNLYGRAFDITTAIDAAAVRISFPGGLFYSEADGDIRGADFVFQVRYRQLDAGNNPITTGGSPNGDGYVRLPPVQLLGIIQRGAFDFEHKFQLLDKNDYTAPTIGKALDLDGVNDYVSSLASTGNPFVSATDIDELTFACWIKPDVGQFPTAGVPGQYKWIAGSYRNSDFRGIGLVVRSRTQGTLHWVPAVVYGNGVDPGGGVDHRFQQADVDYDIPEDAWTHIALSYKRAFDGTLNRYRVYMNGDLAREFTLSATNSTAEWGGLGQFFGRNPDWNNTVYFGSLIDDMLICTEELTQQDIKQQYASGLGTYGSGNTALHGWWPWNDAAGSQLATDPYWNTPTLNGGATSGTTAGLVATAASGSALRSKIRLEVLRINVDSTHAQTVDDAEWVSATGFVSEALAYPLEPLLALHIPANETLNTNTPRVSSLCDGALVPVWDGIDSTFPTTTLTWTANPAWICLGILTEKRWGLGKYYSAVDVDLPAMLSWANYCDDVLWDGTPDYGPDLLDEWVELYYYADTADATGLVRGSIVILFTISPQTTEPPASWAVGTFVRFFNVPVVAGHPAINNTDGISGYEIKSVVYGGEHGFGAWGVVVYWDRLSEGDPWDSTESLYAGQGKPVQGYANGGMRRFEFHGTFDRGVPAWDALLDVAKVGRAVPIRDGRKIRFRFAHPQSPVGLIGMGSIVKDSFKVRYRGGSQSHNSFDVGFLDREHDYERNTATATHASVTNEASLEELRKQATFIPGITHRAQALRQGKFLANVNQELLRTGEFRMHTEALHYEPSDIVRLAHDILPRGVSGRNMAELGADRIKSDRDFTIEVSGAKLYTLYLTRPDTDALEGVAVDKTLTGTGAHVSGDSIICSAAFTFTPAANAPFILCENGTEMVVELSKVSLGQDMTRDVQWIEYKASIFLDELDGVLTDESIFNTDTGLDGTSGFRRAPFSPTVTGHEDTIVKRRGGTFEPVLRVWWMHDKRSVAYVARTHVLISRDGSAWVPVVTVPGKGTFAELGLVDAEAGTVVRIAVQPESFAGKKMPPSFAATFLHQLSGIGAYPEPPTNVAAHMVDDRVTYTWDLPAGQEGNVVECRRGGWILAPIAFASQRGTVAHGPLRDWAGATAGDPTLYFRCRNEIGQYSEAVALAFTPAPRVSAFALPTGQNDQAWESFVDGWVSDTPATGNATLAGLQRHASGYLEFAGASLTGVYTTADPELYGGISLVSSRTPRRCYAEACLVAEQVHPMSWETSEWAWGEDKWRRWTFEGPTHVLPGEIANCTVRIEVRINTSGTNGDWGSWREYRPGVYSLSSCQFRVTFTRPDTTYQIKANSFRTRVRAPDQSMTDHTPFHAALAREVFG